MQPRLVCWATKHICYIWPSSVLTTQAYLTFPFLIQSLSQDSPCSGASSGGHRFQFQLCSDRHIVNITTCTWCYSVRYGLDMVSSSTGVAFECSEHRWHVQLLWCEWNMLHISGAVNFALINIFILSSLYNWIKLFDVQVLYINI